ncbi:acyl-CoA thioesterase [Planctomicrobium piriforme]|uniref:Acyl-CoA thioester hydrolase n=1 Tax=Planctomicrobium piriforme TaxID=1576369 RepID=A0A1I3RN61_9PLAN|nr:thioesterase family protein [Planctomicrobium piriforme]SFJ48004.1 acyl-CoA thioester hydrolase [Planctomicrobium piriforme]
MPPFISHRRVEFSQTDMAGIVHFSNYYKWMEELEHDFFRSLGLKIMEQQPDGTYIGWPRVNASCHFQSPARYEDQIEGRLRVERIGFKSLTYYMEFWRGTQRIAYGRVKTACCICRADGTLSSIEIPKSILDQLHEMPAE